LKPSNPDPLSTEHPLRCCTEGIPAHQGRHAYRRHARVLPDLLHHSSWCRTST